MRQAAGTAGRGTVATPAAAAGGVTGRGTTTERASSAAAAAPAPHVQLEAGGPVQLRLLQGTGRLDGQSLRRGSSAIRRCCTAAAETPRSVSGSASSHAHSCTTTASSRSAAVWDQHPSVSAAVSGCADAWSLSSMFSSSQRALTSMPAPCLSGRAEGTLPSTMMHAKCQTNRLATHEERPYLLGATACVTD